MARRGTTKLELLAREIVACRACPRLVRWREEVARIKVRRFREWDYWGKPVPGFGDPRASLVIVGLAPGAHGANRTGRVFTGDRSGDFLYSALHRAGFANRATSTSADDGLRLERVFILTTIRCAPPGNAPKPDEIARCTPFLDRELDLLPGARVLLALGQIAWNAVLSRFARREGAVPRPRPAFSHGATAAISGEPLLLGSYHVSQQNTQTGRLTASMFDEVLAKAQSVIANEGP